MSSPMNQDVKPSPSSSSSTSSSSSRFSISNAINDALKSVLHLVDLEAVEVASQKMTQNYRSLWKEPERTKIKFETNDQRYAYTRKYVRAHAIAITQVINSCEELKDYLKSFNSNSDPLRVLSLGGGPGSDLLGLLQFYDISHESPPIFINIHDLIPLWAYMWTGLMRAIQKQKWNVIGYYMPFNAETDSIESGVRSTEPNLVICCKFASAIAAIGDEKTSIFYRELFEKLPIGSFVVVIDNNNPTSRLDCFTRTCQIEAKKAPGLQLIAEDDYFPITYQEPDLEDVTQGIYLSQSKGTQNEYKAKFMLIRIWKKVEEAGIKKEENKSQ